jgi:protein-tyrosine phosphatase
MDFDLILAMDQQNLADIQALQYKALQHFALQSLPAQIALMSEHDPIYPQLAVPDPYYGEQEGFERVLDQCESSSKAWAKQIQQQLKG